MKVTWFLFIIWLLLNLVTLAEIGLLYHLGDSWIILSVNTMVLALLIGGILVYARKPDWLALLILGVGGFCLWVLLASF